MTKYKVAILTGGGDSPGHNAVIWAALETCDTLGLELHGVRGGFRGLLSGKPDDVFLLELDRYRGIADRAGGTILGASRDSLAKDEGELAAKAARRLQELGINMLIACGGDDTRRSLDALIEAAKKIGFGDLRVCHASKTIDNDLPLLRGLPTYGFHTAAEKGALLVEELLQNSRADVNNRAFLCEIMGRHAGHLALQVSRNVELCGQGDALGEKFSMPYCFIPEMFQNGVSLEQLIQIVASTIHYSWDQGYRLEGIGLAEGLYDVLHEKDKAIFAPPRLDDHGHVQLALIPFVGPFTNLVKARLDLWKVPFSLRPAEVGYSIRTAKPNESDAKRCQAIGAGAVRYLHEGSSGATIFANEKLEAEFMASQSVPREPNGKIITRTVDLSGPHADYLAPSIAMVKAVMEK